jgi:hypothetical protein
LKLPTYSRSARCSEPNGVEDVGSKNSTDSVQRLPMVVDDGRVFGIAVGLKRVDGEAGPVAARLVSSCHRRPRDLSTTCFDSPARVLKRRCRRARVGRREHVPRFRGID